MTVPLRRRPDRQPSVLIVIVNYCTGPLVVECLTSLKGELSSCPNARAIVVDNASGDTSVQYITEAIAQHGWSEQVTLIASPTNGGFAYGNNQAILRCLHSGTQQPDYVWLLNPDTRVRPGALQALLTFMECHPRAGIAGSLLEEANGMPWSYSFRFPSLLGELERGARLGMVTRLLRNHAVPRLMGDKAEQTDWVSGASMLIRRPVFERTGIMDEGYFLYFEETDFCLQAQRSGWQCWFVPSARVLHIAGQSTGVTNIGAAARRVPAYWFQSRRRYFTKNYGRGYAIAADLLWITAHLLWRLRRRVQSLPDPDPPALLRDFVAHSALFHGDQCAPVSHRMPAPAQVQQ